MAQLYVLTLFLQQVLGIGPAQTGLAFVPMAVASVAAMMLIEAGFMIAEVPLNLAASTALPQRRGLAAGLLGTTTELGNAVGVGLTAAVVAIQTSALGHLPPAHALAGGLRSGLAVAIAAVLAAMSVVLWGMRGESLSKPDWPRPEQM